MRCWNQREGVERKITGGAAKGRSRRMAKMTSGGFAIVLVSALSAPAPALALDAISPARAHASGGAAGEGVACPLLTRIKYPFLSCSRDANGVVVLDSMGAGIQSGHLIDPVSDWLDLGAESQD